MWIVDVEAAPVRRTSRESPRAPAPLRARVTLKRILSYLERFSPEGEAGPGSLRIRLSVEANDAADALSQAMRAVREAFLRSHERSRLALVAVSAEDNGRMDPRLQQVSLPDLLGVAELAELLEVSRQRVSRLARWLARGTEVSFEAGWDFR